MDGFDDILLDNYNVDFEPNTSTQPNNNTTQPTEEASTATKKVKTIRFNEELLLDTKGIPLLRSETRHLIFKGKGYEDQDLKKLMTYYTVWAHNLYPKLRFGDFTRRVGKPASGKRIKSMVNTWQDEYIERMQLRREESNALSGQTVGDEEENGEESSGDDNRPLFFPITDSAKAAIEKFKKTTTKKLTTPSAASQSKYRSNAHINSEDDASDGDVPVTKTPRTITFSDSDDDNDMPSKKSNVTSAAVNGRERALAILAEKKRKQRELAQQIILQEEAEDLEESRKKVMNSKTVDEMINEYYNDDDIQLALSDNELMALDIDPIIKRGSSSAKD